MKVRFLQSFTLKAYCTLITRSLELSCCTDSVSSIRSSYYELVHLWRRTTIEWAALIAAPTFCFAFTRIDCLCVHQVELIDSFSGTCEGRPPWEARAIVKRTGVESRRLTGEAITSVSLSWSTLYSNFVSWLIVWLCVLSFIMIKLDLLNHINDRPVRL